MKFQFIAGCVLSAVALASCSSQKTVLPYFTDITEIKEGTLPVMNYMPVIQPDDELFITVTSLNPVATAIYNLPLANPAQNWGVRGTTSDKQMTYVVTSKGDINFPVLGPIHVAGMTTEQVREDLIKRLSKDVEDPMVTVALVNFKVNVAGEVKTPGQIPLNGNRCSILDALSAAGDLTEYGERSNVLVIREENGERKFAHLDLNSSDILNSPYYYLKQNDYIYVAPNSIRQANSKYNQNNAYKLSVISTVVSAASVIASLVIALSVK
ncbi:MAG: polysaccharide biosynthesis/export family protein [Duncaniella sp.]|nr:polysaccharide biosynthesis/export family protein [Duncaniella sp.]